MQTTEIPNHEVRFSGHSDDCFEIEGAVREESEEGVFQIVDPAGQRINLVSSYGQHNTGMWMLGLQAVEDDDPWPSWAMSWRMADNKYSPELSIDLPAGTTITRIYPEPKMCDECDRLNDPLKLKVG
jgi:hypothetical protein